MTNTSDEHTNIREKESNLRGFLEIPAHVFFILERDLEHEPCVRYHIKTSPSVGSQLDSDLAAHRKFNCEKYFLNNPFIYVHLKELI